MNDNPETAHLQEGLLFEYLDGEMTAADAARLRLHLDACPECRASQEQAQALFAAIVSIPEAPLEVNLSAPVRRRIAAERRPGSHFLNPQAILAVFQVTAVIAILAVSSRSLAAYLKPVQALLAGLQGVYTPPAVMEIWQARLLPLFANLARPVETILSFDFSFLSQYPLALILVAASILWLAGNGLLVWNAHPTRRNP